MSHCITPKITSLSRQQRLYSQAVSVCPNVKPQVTIRGEMLASDLMKTSMPTHRLPQLMDEKTLRVKYCPTCGDTIPKNLFNSHEQACPNKQWNTPVQYLQQNGPTSNDILNQHRFNPSKWPGVEFFNPHGITGDGRVSRVAYLAAHDPDLVIQIWVARNEDDIRTISRSSITRRISSAHDDMWVKAWKEIADEFGFESHQQAPSDAGKDPLKTCPNCGDEIRARQFVSHIQSCQ